MGLLSRSASRYGPRPHGQYPCRQCVPTRLERAPTSLGAVLSVEASSEALGEGLPAQGTPNEIDFTTQCKQIRPLALQRQQRFVQDLRCHLVCQICSRPGIGATRGLKLGEHQALDTPCQYLRLPAVHRLAAKLTGSGIEQEGDGTVLPVLRARWWNRRRPPWRRARQLSPPLISRHRASDIR